MGKEIDFLKKAENRSLQRCYFNLKTRNRRRPKTKFSAFAKFMQHCP